MPRMATAIAPRSSRRQRLLLGRQVDLFANVSCPLHTTATPRPARIVILALVTACMVGLRPQAASAACNLIPGTVKSFNSTLGATNRPFAAPGESLEIKLRPCDSDSPGIPAAASGSVVTVVFTPPSGAKNAVILTAAGDCSAINPQLAACDAQLGGGTSTCISGAASGLQVVERPDGRSLRFSFPDTDSFLGTASDDITLAGPAKIAISAPGEALPCGLATQSCSAQSGLLACVDGYYANDGRCGTGTALATFPGFTALPPPNDYQADCYDDSPPCTATASEVRAALDIHGNLLTPFQWGGILVRDAGIPVPRLLQSRIKSPVPFTLDDQIYIGSYTPEGGLLPPIFEPQRDPTVMDPSTVALFGSADAPYTILRFARNQGSCSGGGRDTLACSNDTDCPGGSCVSSGDNFDFSALPQAPSGGPIVFDRQSTAGFCQDDVSIMCTMNCGMDGPCVNYAYEARIPVPLEGLQATASTRAFAIRESIDGVDRNGDGDTTDTVINLRDRETGQTQDLGATAGCGIPGSPSTRAVVRISDPPFSFPAVEVEDDFVAFLEPEFATNDFSSGESCDVNGDNDGVDSILRVFELGGGEASSAISPPRAVAPELIVGERSHRISGGKVFFRSSEAAMAARRVERVSISDSEQEANGRSYLADGPAITSDGNLIVFSSFANNLVSGDTNGYEDVFVRDRKAGTTERVSLTESGTQALVLPGAPATYGCLSGQSECSSATISADGRFVAFESRFSDLVTGDDNIYQDVFVRDRELLTTTRISQVSDPVFGGPAGSSNNGEPIVSANGRFVVFTSEAGSLDPAGNNFLRDVFLHDRVLGTTTHVSIPPDGVPDNDDQTQDGAVSNDGRFVVMQGWSCNWAFAFTHDCSNRNLYIRDTCISYGESIAGCTPRTDAIAAEGAAWSFYPKISADGNFVAFGSQIPNLVTGDTNGLTDVFVWDRVSDSYERSSMGVNGAQLNSDAHPVVISANGRYVAYMTAASNAVAGDTNGRNDIFLSDRLTGATSRVSLRDDGSEAANGVTTVLGAPGLLPGSLFSVSDDGQVVFTSPTNNLVAGDTNGVTDIFVYGIDHADPLSIDALLFPDGDLDDDVLEVFEPGSGTLTTLCPAEQVAVFGGNAAFLRPEASAGTVTCPAGSLNADADTDDLIVHLYTGSATPANLGRAAQEVSLSGSHVAALVSEEAEGDSDRNGDGDSDDLVVEVRPIPSGGWTGTGQAADELALAGNFALFITSEAAQGAGPLNADGDSDDRILQVWDATAAGLVPCSPVVGAQCTQGVRQAAHEFVAGEPTVTACGTVHLVAFRSSELAEGRNLNASANDKPTGDADLNDDVLQVFDLISGRLQNTGQAVTPCRIPECDPRAPYKIEGGQVRFLTTELDQGGRDLTGEGSFGLALQLYDFCAAVTTTLGEVKPGDGDSNPIDEKSASLSYVVEAGRCVAQAGTCTTAGDTCGADAFCEADTCIPPLCDDDAGVCVGETPERLCLGVSDCGGHCKVNGESCVTDADCGRCILRQPGSCVGDVDCPDGSTCKSSLVVVANAIEDRDDDGVLDEVDNCVDIPNTLQDDLDGDDVGDACDLQSCNNGVLESPEECDNGGANSDTAVDACRTSCQLDICGDGAIDSGEECDDGNAANGDGCSQSCVREHSSPHVVLPESHTAPFTYSDTQQFTESGCTITDATVVLDIDHQFVGNLVIELEHGATTLRLLDRPGNTDPDPVTGGYDGNLAGIYTFSDAGAVFPQAGAAIVQATTYAPEGLRRDGGGGQFADFAGADPIGAWTLRVIDAENGMGGAFYSWSLHLSAICSSSEAPNQSVGAVIGPLAETLITSELSLPETCVVTDLEIDIDATHSYLGELQVDLEHAGTSVRLMNHQGGYLYGNWIDERLAGAYSFRDGAPQIADLVGTVDLPPGEYGPEGPGALADFIGHTGGGVWRLSVLDRWWDGDGTFNSWGLRVDCATAGPRSLSGPTLACGDGVRSTDEECDDGNAVDGDGCTRQCRAWTLQTAECQEALGAASAHYFKARLGAIEKCRNAWNKGTALFLDKDKTLPLANVSNCASEYRAAGKIAKAAAKARLLIADPDEEACQDFEMQTLSACAASVDGVVSADASAGCLLTSHNTSVDDTVADAFGDPLVPAQELEQDCQAAIAKAQRVYTTTRLKAVRNCRDALNDGSTLYFDEAKSSALDDPADCALEYRAAAKIAKAGAAVRKKIAKPGGEKCTDALVATLASLCSATVDGLVAASGDSGCLIDRGNTESDALIEALYGD